MGDQDVEEVIQGMNRVEISPNIRWDSVNKDRFRNKQVNICSWNIDCKLEGEMKKYVIRKTLDNLLLSVILLQETIWAGDDIFTNMKKKKKTRKNKKKTTTTKTTTVTTTNIPNTSEVVVYSVVFNNWKCESLGNKEVAILYDPTVIQPCQQNVEISICWSMYMHKIVLDYKTFNPDVLPERMSVEMSKLKELPRRTIAFAANLTKSFTVHTEQPTVTTYVSLHMFKKVSDTLKIDIAERIIAKAEDLADKFGTFVIIGADWNVVTKKIHDIIVRRTPEARARGLTLTHCLGESKWDSILCITSASGTPYVNESPVIKSWDSILISESEISSIHEAYPEHWPQSIELCF